MIAGGCSCGQLRYTLALDDPPPVYLCHCSLCQRASGAAFAEQAFVTERLLSVTGALTEVALPRANGSTSTHYFCARCLTRIYNRNNARPGFVVVRAGTLDRADELVPRAHMWTSRKQPWLVLDPAVPAWPETPPPEELLAALFGNRAGT